MPKVCGDFSAQLREFNGEYDHVRLLVQHPPKVPVPALVNSLKGIPARRLRPEFTGRVNRHITHGHFWSPSYFAASCGRCPAEHHPPVHRAAPGSSNLRANPALRDEACARLNGHDPGRRLGSQHPRRNARVSRRLLLPDGQT